MKKIVVLFFAFILVNSSYGQGNFSLGNNVASVGIGLGSSLGAFGSSTSSPGISLQYERGMWDVGGPGVISLGGFVGFKSYKYNNVYQQKWKYTVIGLRSAYHYNGIESSDFDVYGGAMLSYNNLSYSDNFPYGYSSNGTWNSYISLTLYVGGRYYFAPNVAAFAELGYGIAYLNIGAAFKF